MKLIKSLKNRGISLKGTSRKITSQEWGFLKFLKSLMTTGLPMIKNVLTPLAKSILIPSGLKAAASATNAAGSGTTALIISNEEMEYIIKKIKSLEESGILTKRISETIKNETKKQKSGFFQYYWEHY